MTRILFVCLGNICRSPTAQVTFEALLRARGLQDRFEVDSAGTWDWHAGELADPRTRAAALSRGLTITHRSRQITDDDYRTFDLIVVMDRSNLSHVRTMAPSEVTLELVDEEHPEMTPRHADARQGTRAKGPGVALFASYLRCDPLHAAWSRVPGDDRRNATPIEVAERTCEVPDPYAGGPAGFEAVLDICVAASRGLLAQLGAGDGAPGLGTVR